jgi:hypothetical protein
MLEQETETIVATLTAKTIGTREIVHLREVLVADIPRGIKTYIRAETLRWLSDELSAAPRFSRIDQNVHGVARITNAFLLSLSEAYAYPRAEYLGLLENAVLFLENYICRPQWTMEKFVFDSTDRVSLRTILTKLDFTVEYGYFKTLIEKIARQRGWSELGLEDFRLMLTAIDDQVVKQHNARELALLAKPIFDFILMRDSPPDMSVPLKPILVFFDDKKMKILREYIESICKLRDRTDITLDELTTLVEDLYLGHSENPPAVPGLPSFETVEMLIEEPTTPDDELPITIEEIVTEEIAVPIEPPALFSYMTEEPDGRADDLPAEREDEQSKGTSPPDTRNAALSLTFAGLNDSPQSISRLPDLNSLISENLRNRFIKRIFDKDEQEYEEVIAALNDARTWKDASLLLNKVYRTIGLDPFEADIVEFTDTIHNRYLDDEGAER